MKKPETDLSVFIADGAIVLGDTVLGKDSSVWYHATIRADRAAIRIGEGSNVQDNAVLHTDQDYGVHIGNYVTIGHSAIVHGATVGDNTVIGMGAIVLNGAKIGRNCIIGAGTLITQNKVIPDNSLVIGSPGKIMRQVTEAEIKSNRDNAAEYIEEAKQSKADSEG